MKFLSALSLTFFLATPIFAAPFSCSISKRAIDQTTFDAFLQTAKLSRAAYVDYAACPRPAGTTALYEIFDRTSDINGFISRDDSRKQIIVAFRGTASNTDVIIDLRNTLVPWTSPGSTGCTGCRVHAGFQDQWNSVAATVITRLRPLVSQYPSYTITVTGHSLGGALSTIAGISLEKTFPGKVTIYSFASPRTGNPQFISFVDGAFPDERIYRITNGDDVVPQDLTQQEGYKHHKVEYWIRSQPASLSTIVKCQGGEDPSCNMSVAKPDAGLGGINAAHGLYMNINFGSTPAQCT